jgi:exodeoxyribonuclease VII small subunit
MAKKTQVPPKNFEDALAELEQILAEIEGGALGLEESLVKYERGNFLIHHCRGVLNTAEKQVELLSKSADGGLSAAPLQPPAGTTPPAAAEDGAGGAPA